MTGGPPTDPATRLDREEMSARNEEARVMTRDAIAKAQKALAAAQGLMQGLGRALEDENVGEDVGRAVREARGVYDASREEARHLAQDPEMQRMKEGVTHQAHAVADRTRDVTHRAGDAVRGRVEHVRETASHAAEKTRERAHDVAQSTRTTAEHARARMHDAAENTRQSYYGAKANVVSKAGAVRDTATRARDAPPRIMEDLKRGFSGWKSNMMQAIGLFVGAAALAITFLVIFAIWLVVGLNAILGDPLGTFVAALVFAALAGAAVMVARNRVNEASDEWSDARADVRDEIDYVKRPMRREFGRRST